MESLLQDLSSAFRQVRRHPAFVILAVTTLGLGIGTNLNFIFFLTFN